MAEHLLQAAQIRTMGQKVAGKGVTQNMRADLCGIKSCTNSKFFQHLRKAMAR